MPNSLEDIRNRKTLFDDIKDQPLPEAAKTVIKTLSDGITGKPKPEQPPSKPEQPKK